MHVVIIGSGIGGLCLAQGLRSAGVAVTVCERDAAVDDRYQGYRIGLNQHGLQALADCLPPRLYELVESTCGDQIGARPVTDEQLRQTSDLGWVAGGTVADRRVLRHVLLTGLDADLRFGKQFTRYEELPDGTVRAEFADGTSTVADVLVGADGIGSAVRRQLLPHAVITDTGVRCLLGRTELTDRFARLVPGAGKVVIGPNATLMLGKMAFRRRPDQLAAQLPATADYLRWVLMVPSGQPTIDAAALTADWHPELRAVIAEQTTSSLISIRSAEPVPAWRPGPVTLLGDAIHAMSPSGGSGGNTALRDANLLRRKLIDSGRAGIGDYEAHMREYGFAAVAASLAALPTFVPQLT
ncbi:FAD-dependent monooxygenase [Kutzneria viridogrisea]|uniref:2-polyprenyl-6-methoxyphenol hydroxylase-like FAD-dependent oxidoreductase n=1 Tax=Kutzneria viridogrisea TaxID=47990 RepID=A0ABR6BAN3_9PSEU|nr:2-polyprenyl-6-methoxyphenol hydroxylase-like FAD-dependent oxidoreductase [Kutzneria viridogrisea]